MAWGDVALQSWESRLDFYPPVILHSSCIYLIQYPFSPGKTFIIALPPLRIIYPYSFTFTSHRIQCMSIRNVRMIYHEHNLYNPSLPTWYPSSSLSTTSKYRNSNHLLKAKAARSSSEQNRGRIVEIYLFIQENRTNPNSQASSWKNCNALGKHCHYSYHQKGL